MPKPFEWYYFDLHSDDGYDLVFTLHSRPFMTLFSVSIFDIFIYKDNRLIQHIFFARPLSELVKNKEPYEVYFDSGNYILYNKEKIDVRALNSQIAIHLQFSGLLKPEKRLNQNLLTGNQKNESFSWKLLAPLGQGRAAIQIGDRQLHLTGRAYHDYNAGNISLKKELLGWRWGKYYFNNAMLIIGEIVLRKGSVKKELVLVRGNDLLQCEQFELSRSQGKIFLKSDLMDFEILETKQYQLDDIRFLSMEPAKILLLPAKIFELVFAVLMRFKFSSPLIKILANVRYIRRRLSGQNADGQTAQIFQEEIFF